MAAIVYQSKLKRFSDLVNELEKGTPLRSLFQTILAEVNVTRDIDLTYVIDELTEALLKCRVFAYRRDASNRKGLFFVPFIPEMVFRLSMKRKLKTIKDKFKIGKTFPIEKVYGSLDSSCPSDSKKLVGFADAQNKLTQIIKHGSQSSDDKFIAYSIVGEGGSGKTALAQKLFNSFGDQEFEIRIWVSMSKHLYSKTGYKSILIMIFQKLSKISGEDPSLVDQIDELELLKKLRYKLENKSYLIVLDGVHHMEDWLRNLGSYNLVEGEVNSNKLSHGLPKRSGNGAVIVTTREEDVAQKMVGKNIYRMERMKDDECWKIFQNSFGDDGYQDTLSRMKEDICNDCKGLPLVAKALGTIVRRSELVTHRWD